MENKVKPEEYYVSVRGLKTLVDKIMAMKAEISDDNANDIKEAKNELNELIDSLKATVEGNIKEDTDQQTLLEELVGKLDTLKANDEAKEAQIKKLNESLKTINDNLVTAINTINKNVADGFNTINGGVAAIKKTAEEAKALADTSVQKVKSDDGDVITLKVGDTIKCTNLFGDDIVVATVNKDNQLVIGNNTLSMVLEASGKPTVSGKGVVTSDEIDALTARVAALENK